MGIQRAGAWPKHARISMRRIYMQWRLRDGARGLSGLDRERTVQPAQCVGANEGDAGEVAEAERLEPWPAALERQELVHGRIAARRLRARLGLGSGGCKGRVQELGILAARLPLRVFALRISIRLPSDDTKRTGRVTISSARKRWTACRARAEMAAVNRNRQHDTADSIHKTFRALHALARREGRNALPDTRAAPDPVCAAVRMAVERGTAGWRRYLAANPSRLPHYYRLLRACRGCTALEGWTAIKHWRTHGQDVGRTSSAMVVGYQF